MSCWSDQESQLSIYLYLTGCSVSQHSKHMCIVHCPWSSLPLWYRSCTTGRDGHAKASFSCSSGSRDFLSSSLSSHGLLLLRQLFLPCSTYLRLQVRMPGPFQALVSWSPKPSCITWFTWITLLTVGPSISVLHFSTLPFWCSELLCPFNCI